MPDRADQRTALSPSRSPAKILSVPTGPTLCHTAGQMLTTLYTACLRVGRVDYPQYYSSHSSVLAVVVAGTDTRYTLGTYPFVMGVTFSGVLLSTLVDGAGVEEANARCDGIGWYGGSVVLPCITI